MCDNGFYSRMMSLCRQQHPWWDPRRYICYRVAATYYWGVRKFGWFPFYFGKRC